jgi:hypothetical protein
MGNYCNPPSVVSFLYVEFLFIFLIFFSSRIISRVHDIKYHFMICQVLVLQHRTTIVKRDEIGLKKKRKDQKKRKDVNEFFYFFLRWFSVYNPNTISLFMEHQFVKPNYNF